MKGVSILSGQPLFYPLRTQFGFLRQRSNTSITPDPSNIVIRCRQPFLLLPHDELSLKSRNCAIYANGSHFSSFLALNASTFLFLALTGSFFLFSQFPLDCRSSTCERCSVSLTSEWADLILCRICIRRGWFTMHPVPQTTVPNQVARYVTLTKSTSKLTPTVWMIESFPVSQNIIPQVHNITSFDDFTLED